MSFHLPIIPLNMEFKELFLLIIIIMANLELAKFRIFEDIIKLTTEVTVPLNFGRAPGVGEIIVDRDLCNGCGICVEVCIGGPLALQDGHLTVIQGSLFDCIACGACAAFCPMDALRVTGRDLFPGDVIPLADQATLPGYDSLQHLFLQRRSVRNFQDREVESGIVQKILDAASTAPMGLPPSEVGVLVFSGRKAVDEVRQGLLDQLGRWKWMFSPIFLGLMCPFVSRDTYAMYHDFVAPAVKVFKEKNSQGLDWFLYDAPLVYYFYASSVSDPADPLIAATHAMVAAESLNLGTCMLGFPGYLFQYSTILRKKYEMPSRIQPGIMLACGYPRYSTHQAVRRRFADVKLFNG